MIRRLGFLLDRICRAITPDPFVLAIFLSALTMLMALLFTPAGPSQIIEAWQGPRGFWGLLAFAMQMCLVLITGHALASTPIVGRLIGKLVSLPSSAASATALVAFVAVATSLLNWGLALIVGALVAREMGRSCARRGIHAHYPALAAAGYTGMMTWHGGFSGSAPLKVTTEKDLVELLGSELAARVDPIPIESTLLSPMNLIITGGLLFLVPLVAYFLAPRSTDEISTFEDYAIAGQAEGSPADRREQTVIARIEDSRLTTLILAVPLVLALVIYYREYGVSSLDPNAVNLTLLTFGLLLHGTPHAYGRAASSAVSGCAGIILQFPLYGGIMGIMGGTGLARVFASWAMSAGSPAVFVAFTFLSAALINLFVPSGGGQWAVQGPIAVEAASNIGASLSTAVMAVAYGDQLTNMLQPFWALPLLGITGVKAKEIVGYTAVIMLAGGLWILTGLLLFG